MQSAVISFATCYITFIWFIGSYNIISFLRVIAGYKVCDLRLIAVLLLAVLCSYHYYL